MRPWIRDMERLDDTPAHVNAMVNGVALYVPVTQGRLARGTWQGIELVEHLRRHTAARLCCDVSARAD
jgi:thiamine phosphate synthase YjbQ (UPF0047 family)